MAISMTPISTTPMLNIPKMINTTVKNILRGMASQSQRTPRLSPSLPLQAEVAQALPLPPMLHLRTITRLKVTITLRPP